ncbi:hypothetical protein [Spirosoma endophyticum]|nr:hypothetical protein [Spirosoma endophyticum]
MNDSTSPFQGKTVPLHGKPMTFENIEAAGLTEEELEIQAVEEGLAQRKAQLQQQKQAAAAEERNRLTVQLNKAKDAGVNFRREARETTSEAEKRQLYEWATEADLEVGRLESELGIVRKADQPAVRHQTFFQRNRWAVAVCQVLAVLVAVLYFHGQFNNFGDNIREINHGLQADEKMNAYDDTSMQKLMYEKMVVFIDIPLALLLLFIVAPFMGNYVLPFMKSKKDFYTEFFEDLTPWQRSIITIILSLGLLFYLAVSHNVKP